MQKNDFLDDLMECIIEGINIPKVQVERVITPILGMFLESILNRVFAEHSKFSGSYTLVSPEFPLKKENNQSTNMDYLLVNNLKKILVFFELKTNPKSFDTEQMNRYIHYKRTIKYETASILKDNLNKISKASPIADKYRYVIPRFESSVSAPQEIKNIVIVYLVPRAIKEELSNNEDIDFVMSFSDLPERVEHKYAQEWATIRKNLLKLDDFFQVKSRNESVESAFKAIVENIKKFVSTENESRKPESFRIGILGHGSNPNYQVEFSDGSIQTFRFSGEPHHIKLFKDSNLSTEYFWEDVKE